MVKMITTREECGVTRRVHTTPTASTLIQAKQDTTRPLHTTFIWYSLYARFTGSRTRMISRTSGSCKCSMRRKEAPKIGRWLGVGRENLRSSPHRVNPCCQVYDRECMIGMDTVTTKDDYQPYHERQPLYTMVDTEVCHRSFSSSSFSPAVAGFGRRFYWPSRTVLLLRRCRALSA